ncbi:MAG: HAD family hydrolase [Sphaerochaetaceae bacterium]|nr:HAD family hydrolase [Sphaerochaetaceae bacterium]
MQTTFDTQHIDWIFFDVGCTLVDESHVWKRRAHEQYELEKDRLVSLGLDEDGLYRAIMEGYAVPGTKYRHTAERLGLVTLAPYQTELETLYDGVFQMLRSLKDCYHLGIIANQSTGLSERLKGYGILDLFDLVVSSADIGVKKPAPEIFQYALEKAGCSASRSVMVGDRLDNDIEPAKALGFHTIRIVQGISSGQMPSRPSEEAEVTVHSISELSEVFH